MGECSFDGETSFVLVFLKLGWTDVSICLVQVTIMFGLTWFQISVGWSKCRQDTYFLLNFLQFF